jgi:hypothetical protein
MGVFGSCGSPQWKPTGNAHTESFNARLRAARLTTSVDVRASVVGQVTN